MVAIVTGNQLGFAGSSGSVLGAAGQVGNAALGQAKKRLTSIPRQIILPFNAKTKFSLAVAPISV